MSSLKPFLQIFGAITGAIFPISLILFIHQRALTPLYGSYPTTYLLDVVTFLAIILSTPISLKARDAKNCLYAGLALSVAPNATYWIAVWTSRRKWPVVGPAITHFVVLTPLLSLFANFMETDTANSGTVETPLQTRMIRRISGMFIASMLANKFWPKVTQLNSISESQIYLFLAGASLSIYILNMNFPIPDAEGGKSKKKAKQRTGRLSTSQIRFTLLAIFVAVWWSVHFHLANPVLPHPLKETYTHPTGKLQIHSAVQSVTGLIVVGETLPPLNGEDDPLHSARYLRASHSILGGVWLRDKVQTLDDEPPLVDSFGTPLGDTFYSAFVLQEAARLINSTEVGKAGAWKNALAIGLGTGLSATAFIRHGLSTTIVEIDPAVYDAARTWFGMPDPGPNNVFLEDARTWVEGRRKAIEEASPTKLFDIVVHDCFSGGGVPEHIFTSEFWNDLKQTMQAEGVLVLNVAGEAKSESIKLILHTLEHNFRQCRAFHDRLDALEEDQYETEFINIVFFCTDSAAPLTFRKPRRSDYLGSPLRRHVFQSLSEHEVHLDAIRITNATEAARYVLTDEENPLGNLQRKQRLHHWTLMRQVLPDLHWETY